MPPSTLAAVAAALLVQGAASFAVPPRKPPPPAYLGEEWWSGEELGVTVDRPAVTAAGVEVEESTADPCFWRTEDCEVEECDTDAEAQDGDAPCEAPPLAVQPSDVIASATEVLELELPCVTTQVDCELEDAAGIDAAAQRAAGREPDGDLSSEVGSDPCFWDSDCDTFER